MLGDPDVEGLKDTDGERDTDGAKVGAKSIVTTCNVVPISGAAASIAV